MQQADEYANNTFDLLGSGKSTFTKIPWHQDFKLSDGDNTFNKHAFYKDISSALGKKKLVKDIKVPWELSRLLHLYVLGKAYKKSLNQKYVRTFTEHITDWLDNNPFLLGTNWVCPMDVGIRAVNLVWGFYFFKDVSTIDDTFWQRFVCSLHDHFFYLENNWEVFDSRTSNHYLSDLIGYFYLCCFFKDLPGIKKKTDWCYKELLKEFDKQIFDEGADYESSTSYHKLITEIFHHFYLLCQELDLPVPQNFLHKFKRMVSYINWCTPHNGMLVLIGDNDSGQLLHQGLTSTVLQQYKNKQQGDVAHFAQAGLSVIKTKKVHVTLRHHAYNNWQPSGHFHNDSNSITLAVNGISVFVDPGVFVYTPSVYWRNYFRSAQVHNAFFIKDHEPVPLDEKLFTLAMDEQKSMYEPVVTGKNTILKAQHNQYKKFGLFAIREINFDNRNTIIITDTWHGTRDNDLISCWNFTLAPCIEVQKKEKGIVLLYQQAQLVQLTSNDFDFTVCDGWFAPAYGVKEKTLCLQAQQQLQLQKNIKITIELL